MQSGSAQRAKPQSSGSSKRGHDCVKNTPKIISASHSDSEPPKKTTKTLSTRTLVDNDEIIIEKEAISKRSVFNIHWNPPFHDWQRQFVENWDLPSGLINPEHFICALFY